MTSGRPRKSSAKPETRLDLVDLLGWPPAGGGQNMSRQEGSAKPARKRSCVMKRICLRYTKKASLRVIVMFHHLKTVGCGLTVLPLQNAEALYVGLGLHQIPFEILRPQRSLKTVGPMKETYFIVRSVDIEAHTNAAIAQAATFCNLSQISEINNRMGVNHKYTIQALYKSENSSLFHFILQFIVEHVEHGRLRCVTAVCGRGWKCSMVWWKRASRKCRKAQSAFPALASNET